MTVEIIDPVADYAELMESLFDFDQIRSLFQGQPGRKVPHGVRRAQRRHRPLRDVRSWKSAWALRRGPC